RTSPHIGFWVPGSGRSGFRVQGSAFRVVRRRAARRGMNPELRTRNPEPRTLIARLLSTPAGVPVYKPGRSMAELLQQLTNGLSLGAIYALIALGYTMVYGVLRFINFAHSDVFMVGAFAGYYFGHMADWKFNLRLGGLAWHWTVPSWLVLPTNSWWGGLLILCVAMLLCAALGMLIERSAYRPLRSRSKLTVLITAIGVSLLLENTGQLVFGANPQPFPDIFPSHRFEFGQLVVSSKDIVVVLVTIALLAALRFIVLRTRIGTAMRAVAFNPQAASLMG